MELKRSRVASAARGSSQETRQQGGRRRGRGYRHTGEEGRGPNSKDRANRMETSREAWAQDQQQEMRERETGGSAQGGRGAEPEAPVREEGGNQPALFWKTSPEWASNATHLSGQEATGQSQSQACRGQEPPAGRGRVAWGGAMTEGRGFCLLLWTRKHEPICRARSTRGRRQWCREVPQEGLGEERERRPPSRPAREKGQTRSS